MVGGTGRPHKVHDGLARDPVVNNDGSLVTTGGFTDAAAVPATLQNHFARAATILLILPFQRIAS